MTRASRQKNSEANEKESQDLFPLRGHRRVVNRSHRRGSAGRCWEFTLVIAYFHQQSLYRRDAILFPYHLPRTMGWNLSGSCRPMAASLLVEIIGTMGPPKESIMKTIPLLVGLITLGLLSACSDDDADQSMGQEHNGLYQITKYQSKDGCSEQQPWVDQAPKSQYFKLNAASLMGTRILEWHWCSGPSENTCDEAIDLVGSFVWDQGQWKSSITWAMGSAPDCSLGSTQGIPVFSSTGMELTIRTSEGQVQLQGSEKCKTELVDKYRD